MPPRAAGGTFNHGKPVASRVLRPTCRFKRRHAMTESTLERAFIVFFRLALGWTFLYAASHQVFVPDWSVVGFLSHTKTFHELFAAFTTPTMAPLTTFLVEYGHLLIGLSLITGLMVRVS